MDTLNTNPTPIPKSKYLVLGFSAIIVSVALFGVILFEKERAKVNGAALLVGAMATSTEKKIPNISLEAKAVVIYDLKNRDVLFGFNEDTPLPLASLTKIMTAIVAKENGYGKDDRERDILIELLVSSSNESARIIEKEISARVGVPFVNLLNKKARELNLPTLYFSNGVGVDEGKDMAGGYGSAKDIVQLLGYGLSEYPLIFGNTRFSNVALSRGGYATNTNLAIDSIPGLLAGKTGTTALSGGNLAVIITLGPNKVLGISILGGTEEGRFKDIETLTWAALHNL